MTGVTWVLLFRPFIYLVIFACVIAPITWVLFKIIPDGRFKVMLFRVREDTWRDRWPLVVIIVLFYVALAVYGTLPYW